jgi:very-short-patch-repair endonuclease
VGSRFRLGRPTAEVRVLRNNPTPHETMLWLQLKGSRLAGLKFSRQMPISGYRVDFVCRSKRLVIELDGSQHAEAMEYDASRTRAIEQAGYRVIRCWNNDLTNNMEGVLETILAAAILTDRGPTPQPPPASGKGERKSGAGGAQ